MGARHAWGGAYGDHERRLNANRNNIRTIPKREWKEAVARLRSWEAGGWIGACPQCSGTGANCGSVCSACGGCGGLDESGAPVNKNYEVTP